MSLLFPLNFLLFFTWYRFLSINVSAHHLLIWSQFFILFLQWFLEIIFLVDFILNIDCLLVKLIYRHFNHFFSRSGVPIWDWTIYNLLRLIIRMWHWRVRILIQRFAWRQNAYSYCSFVVLNLLRSVDIWWYSPNTFLRFIGSFAYSQLS
jgi:hypothetical protein